MNELIDLVAQKAGISREQAQQAVSVVLEFIKGKLPPAFAGQVDALIAGDSKGIQSLADGFLKSKFAGLFGGKTE